MATALLRPGEAGRLIGVKPSTLRVYAHRFGDLLSEDATAGGREGYRFYTGQDVAALGRARELLERGFTYERAAAELRAAGLGRSTMPPRVRRGTARLAQPESVGVDVGGQLGILEQALQAWRGLAEERAVELGALREELARLREENARLRVHPPRLTRTQPSVRRPVRAR